MPPAPSFPYEGKTLLHVTPVEERTQPWKFPPPPNVPHTTLAEDMNSPYIRGVSTRQMIADVMRPGDQLYYWNGPWTNLSGSSGLAVVRAGRVIDTFIFVMA